MRVARIQRVRSRLPRYRVVFEDGESLELSGEIVARAVLALGDDVSDRQFERLRSEQEEFDARRVAVNYVSYRPRSRREVVQHLIKKGISEEVAEGTASRLVELRMIDDKTFAEMYVRDRLRRGSGGALLLRQQLIHKGIPRVQADKIVQDLVPEAGQRENAGRLVQKLLDRRTTLRRLPPPKRRQRLFDMLLRKGYSSDTARRVLANIKV